jgi:hypothetical protein
MCVCVHVCVCMCVYVLYVCMYYMCVRVHVCVCAYVYVLCVCMCVCVLCVCMCVGILFVEHSLLIPIILIIALFMNLHRITSHVHWACAAFDSTGVLCPPG